MKAKLVKQTPYWGIIVTFTWATCWQVNCLSPQVWVSLEMSQYRQFQVNLQNKSLYILLSAGLSRWG